MNPLSPYEPMPQAAPDLMPVIRRPFVLAPAGGQRLVHAVSAPTLAPLAASAPQADVDAPWVPPKPRGVLHRVDLDFELYRADLTRKLKDRPKSERPAYLRDRWEALAEFARFLAMPDQDRATATCLAPMQFNWIAGNLPRDARLALARRATRPEAFENLPSAFYARTALVICFFQLQSLYAHLPQSQLEAERNEPITPRGGASAPPDAPRIARELQELRNLAIEKALDLLRKRAEGPGPAMLAEGPPPALVAAAAFPDSKHGSATSEGAVAASPGCIRGEVPPAEAQESADPLIEFEKHFKEGLATCVSQQQRRAFLGETWRLVSAPRQFMRMDDDELAKALHLCSRQLQLIAGRLPDRSLRSMARQAQNPEAYLCLENEAQLRRIGLPLCELRLRAVCVHLDDVEDANPRRHAFSSSSALAEMTRELAQVKDRVLREIQHSRARGAWIAPSTPPGAPMPSSEVAERQMAGAWEPIADAQDSIPFQTVKRPCLESDRAESESWGDRAREAPPTGAGRPASEQERRSFEEFADQVFA